MNELTQIITMYNNGYLSARAMQSAIILLNTGRVVRGNMRASELNIIEDIMSENYIISYSRKEIAITIRIKTL